jgi:hypothetical protein
MRGNMAYFCEIVGCENDAEYWDDMDARICFDHLIQDMDETGKMPEDYEKIYEGKESDDDKWWGPLQ